MKPRSRNTYVFSGSARGETSSAAAADPQAGSSDIAFDENERKKFAALAEPFLHESVSNLPQMLEETINSFHNKNAESLVVNKLDLEGARNDLGSILAKLERSLETAVETHNNERAVSEKLRSIDLNSDKDATVVMNKKEAAKILSQIRDDASVPPEWVVIGAPRLGALKELPHTFKVLMELQKVIDSKVVPQSLIGMKVAEERERNLNHLTQTFSNALVTHIENTLPKINIIQVFAKNAPPVDPIPSDKLYEDEKKDDEKKDEEKKDDEKKDEEKKDDEKKDEEKKDEEKKDDEKKDEEKKDDEKKDEEKKNDNEKENKNKTDESTEETGSKDSKDKEKKTTNNETNKPRTAPVGRRPPLAKRPVARTKFSVPDTSNHPLLKSINLYWNFIKWAKVYYYDSCYLKIRKTYMQCANSYFLSVVGTRFIQKVPIINSLERSKPVPTEPFATDDEYLQPQAKQLVSLIEETLNDFFHSLEIEGCALTEYWRIHDRHTLSQIVTKQMIEYNKALIEAIKMYDPIFCIVPYRICARAEKKSVIPISDIAKVSREFWKSYINGMFADLREQKVQKNKATILPVFKNIPQFISVLAAINPPDDLEIIERTTVEIIDELINYLTEDIVSKIPKKTRKSRIIILNLFHLVFKIKRIEIFKNSTILSRKVYLVQVLLKENVDVLLNQMAAKIWPDAYTFFNQIDEWMKQEGFSYEIVTYQVTHTLDKFKDLNDKIDKKITNSINECFSFLKKKIHAENLRRELKGNVVLFLQDLFQRWSNIAVECYGIKLTTTPEKVSQIMKENPKS